MSLETISNVKDCPYDEKKWIYEQTEDKSHRFILGTRGDNPLFCIGINPSTAAPDNLDPTLKNVQRFAHNFGFDSFIMFNIYPLRATNPNDLPLYLDEEMHSQNLRTFRKMLNGKKSKNSLFNLTNKKNHIWAAWGTIISKRPYLKNCLVDYYEIASATNASWYSVGAISKDGHPHHPLYLNKESTLDDFDIEKYIDQII